MSIQLGNFSTLDEVLLSHTSVLHSNEVLQTSKLKAKDMLEQDYIASIRNVSFQSFKLILKKLAHNRTFIFKAKIIGKKKRKKKAGLRINGGNTEK